jgi:hypothetical protein
MTARNTDNSDEAEAFFRRRRVAQGKTGLRDEALAALGAAQALIEAAAATKAGAAKRGQIVTACAAIEAARRPGAGEGHLRVALVAARTAVDALCHTGFARAHGGALIDAKEALGAALARLTPCKPRSGSGSGP